MKKLLVLLLVLAMVLPMALCANAEAQKESFYALGWSEFDDAAYPHLYGLVTSNFSVADETAKITYAGNSVTYGAYTDEDVTNFANALMAEMVRRPAGARYWHLWAPARVLRLAPENVLFLDKGVTQMQDLFTAIIKKLKQLDCPLDGVVLDTEYIGLGSWYIYSGGKSQPNNFQDNPNVYADIVADKRYATQIRPLLEERGFPFWPNPSGVTSEIYSIYNGNKGEEYELARSIWDTVVRIHLNNYANQWCYTPLREYYPEASLSDYQSHDSNAWLKVYNAAADGVSQTGGNSVKVGTASSTSYYYSRPGEDFYAENSQYASYNDAVFEASAFNTMMYSINFTRHMLSSTDTKQIAPWITSYVYGGEKEHSIAYTPYYSELLYHLGMFDPEPFLSYTYVNEYSDNGEKGNFQSKKYLSTQQVMNEILAELTRVAGYADREPIEMPQHWNSEFLVSGMYCGGRNLWRISPNTDEVSLEDFKIEGKDPTFCVNGQTVTFPGGKILEETAISEVGTCGYWVETAKDVTPVVTSDADRYVKYPAFSENFDSYEDGKLTVSKMNPSYAWGLFINDADTDTATVVDAGDGKALALTGSARVQNINIPAKITAGDSYAKNQTWEMTVTVPDALDPAAEVYLLKYEGSGTRMFDGGVMIKDGAVYYGQIVDNAYVEQKMLTNIKPGTYTFQRVMNFSDPDNFTFDLYVLNSKGKQVAAVKNVPTPTFREITAISFFTRFADKAVLFDDYKLYPSGVATDFELYDATTGRNAEAETPIAGNAAYRLSWLNGSAAAQTATLVAAIYENGNLKEEKTVKTFTMEPGCDGVDTGVVEVEEGQSVQLSLETTQADTAKNDKITVEKDFLTVIKDINPVTALIVAGAVILLAVIVVVVRFSTKKVPVPPMEFSEKKSEETEE